MAVNHSSSLQQFDSHYRKGHIDSIAGVDEAGRGPLAGPVVAAAVILPPDCIHPQIRDSKKLTSSQREHLYDWIMENATEVQTGISWPSDIDNYNILQATIHAMKSAVNHLKIHTDLILVDGNPYFWNGKKAKFIKKGDSKSLSIAAASIIAKVSRDKILERYNSIFPEYGFEQHKGYGTRGHLAALEKFGATPIHRKTFNPVHKYLPKIESMKNREIGKLGEQIAACGIVRSGCQVLEMNYNVPGVGEIDLIHREGDELIFTEVKTISTNDKFNSPESRIDQNKAERIMSAAGQYLEEKDFGENIRFDVISVRFFNQNPRISRLKNGLLL